MHNQGSIGIKSKMGLLTGIPIILFVVLGALNFGTIRNLVDIESYVSRSSDTQLLIAELETSLSNFSIAIIQYDGADADSLKSYVVARQKINHQITELVKQVGNSPIQLGRLQTFENQFNILLHQSENSKPGVSFVNLVEPLNIELSRMRAIELDVLERHQATFSSIGESVKEILVLGSIIVVALSILLAYVIAIGVTKQLKDTLVGIEHIVNADYSNPVKVVSNDDLGKVAIEVNTLLTTLQNTSVLAKNIAQGNYEVIVEPVSSKDELGIALQNMTTALVDHEISISQRQSKLEMEYWIKSTYTEIVDHLQSIKDIETFGDRLLKALIPALGAEVGAYYHTSENESVELFDDEFTSSLSLIASYALDESDDLTKQFSLGEGLIGQSAIERKTIMLADIPDNYLNIKSGSINSKPKNIILFPIEFEESLLSVVEIGSLGMFSQEHQSLIKLLQKNVGVIINNILGRERTEAFLQQSQSQGRELFEKHEQLMLANVDLEQRKKEVETAKNLIEIKAHELAVASKYKSEFLANMSHELRTPLNSLLVLSKILSQNKEGNLNERQKESASIIHNGGVELLELINEILDLSKVESGKMTLHIETVSFEELITSIKHKFEPLSRGKRFEFIIEEDENLPESFESDSQRTLQILKNLLSNAFKFTQDGMVKLNVFIPHRGTVFKQPHLNKDNCVGLSVVDSGIGIPEEKQALIFEAFQQADGTTSRNFGGTGLGLTITREMCRLLGGELHISSAPSQGCNFTIYLPFENTGKYGEENINPATLLSFVEYHSIQSEIDLSKFKVKKVDSVRKGVRSKRRSGHKGEAKGAKSIADKDDVFIKSKLKKIPSSESDSNTTNEQHSSVDCSGHTVLLVDDDMRNIFALAGELEESGLIVRTAENGQHALEILEKEDQIELVMMDMIMPVMDGYEAIREIRANDKLKELPVIALTAQAMPEDKMKCLEAGADEYMNKPVETDKLLLMIQSSFANRTDDSPTASH